MDSTGLYDAFRTDVVDLARPYFWSDDEVWRYAADAQRQFTRLTGGVSDVLSDVTAVDIVTGEAWADLHPSILRIMAATRRSDHKPIELINSTDLGKMRSSDYGQIKALILDELAGPVRYGVIGMQRNKIRWVQVPLVDDIADLHVYRMPLTVIDGPGQEIADVDEEHHLHLLNWMKSLAYMKSDADTFDPKKAQESEAKFRGYCEQVKSEWQRYKHKTRTVSYGGIL